MVILKWREKDRVKEGRWRWKREELRSRVAEHKVPSPAKNSWVENSSTFFFSKLFRQSWSERTFQNFSL